MKSRDELHEYWKNPEEKNQPDKYIHHEYRTEYLVNLVEHYIDKSSTILELGCNIGRNMNGLRLGGYWNVTGIEINETAKDLMLNQYPALHPSLVAVGAIEDEVRRLGKRDLIFSMCVLMHIHPDSNWVFEEIAKHTQRCIITIEDEVKETWRHCPRNYKEIFEPFGFEQVFEEHVPWGENGCIARVMKRVGTN